MAQEQQKKNNSRRSRSGGASRRRGSANRNTSNAGSFKGQATAPQQDDVLIAPPKYRKGSMRITPLGGLGEIGRNMNVIEYNGHLLLIDCGVLFPEEEQPGVDLILPDFSYIKNRLDKVDALVLTHGHEDHIGGVPYLLKLRPDIPLIGSKLTLAFVEAKCQEHNQHPTMVEVKGRDKLKVGPFNLEFVTVTHSIPDALAVYVKTPAGSLIDTGDIKLDQLPLDHKITDLVEFGKIGEQGVDLLMMDSTNAEVPGFVKPETSIGPALDQAFAQASRKIIVASFSSHVHRVQQVVDVAHKYGRKVVFVGRSMVRNMSIAADLGYLHIPEGTVIDLKKAHDVQDDKLVFMCTGSQGEPLSALSRMANGEHKTLSIHEGDTVILSATPVPGNEKAVQQVVNSLAKLGCDVWDKSRALVHVSGHGSQEELKLLMAMAKPTYFMPVHGEAVHLRAHAQLARKMGLKDDHIFILDNGDTLEMRGGIVKRGAPVESGVVYVDGLRIGDTDPIVLRDRQKLANDGMVTAVAIVSLKHKKIEAIEFSGRGVSFAIDDQFSEDASAAIMKTIEKGKFSFTSSGSDAIRKAVRDSLSNFIWSRTRTRPMIIPVVMEV